MAAWDRFVEAVGVWLADEAYGKDDGYEIQNVDHDECLAYQFEGANCEDANVEEEHRNSYADCRRIPYDVDRDKRLFSVNIVPVRLYSTRLGTFEAKRASASVNFSTGSPHPEAKSGNGSQYSGSLNISSPRSPTYPSITEQPSLY